MLMKKQSLRWRRTKIVATLGPATSSAPVIDSLLKAGVDVVRLNMSHGDHAGHRALIKLVRATSRKLGRHVGILADLCGPKIRVGTFGGDSVILRRGEKVIIDSRSSISVGGRIPSLYKSLHKDVRPQHRILLDDGNLKLKVLSISGTQVHCQVIYGGELKDHKGINLPDSQVSTPSLTTKDRSDCDFAIRMGVDYIALSFVRNKSDVLGLKKIIAARGSAIPVIAKIETPQAVDNIEQILEISDAIMIARGDLGIELPAESVPLIQQELIQRARANNRPVIVATQMLESMITHSRPTRAEVGDVANAAMSSADAVMLSAETASGLYPLRAVQTMDRILREIETYKWQQGTFASELKFKEVVPIRDAVAHAAATLARDLGLQGIIIPTRSGVTARVISSYRPTAPLIGVSSELSICQRMSLYWGVIPILIDDKEVRNWKLLCHSVAKTCKLTRSGNQLLLVSGFNDDPKLNEPMLKIMQV